MVHRKNYSCQCIIIMTGFVKGDLSHTFNFINSKACITNYCQKNKEPLNFSPSVDNPFYVGAHVGAHVGAQVMNHQKN